MPRSKNPDNYPSYFRELLEGARGVEDGITIDFGTAQKRMRVRNQLYAYINALEAQEERREIPYEMRMSPGFRMISLVVQGTSLQFLDKEFDESGMVIMAALRARGIEPKTHSDVATEQFKAAMAVMEAEEAKASPSGELDYRALTTRPTVEVDEPVDEAGPSAPPGFNPANYKD